MKFNIKLVCLILLIPFWSACGKSDGDDISLSYISLNHDRVEVGPTIKEVTVVVKSSALWRATGKNHWSILTKKEGRSGDEVKFLLEENLSGKARTNEYLFFTDDKTVKLTIEQQAEEYFRYESESEYSLADKEETLLLSVNSNSVYTVEVPDEFTNWIVVPSAGKESYESRIKVVVTENDTFKERKGMLRIKHSDDTYDISILQIQNNALVIAEEKYSVDTEEQVLEIPVMTNIPIQVEYQYGSEKWITLLPIEQQIEGKGLQEVKVRMQLPKSAHSRSGRITIKSAKPNVYISKEIIIEQKNPNAVIIDLKDPEFAAALSRLGIVYIGDDGTYETTTQAIEETSTLNLSMSAISSIEGVEVFTNLIDLNVANAKLAVIDVSKNEKLETLSCSSNGLNHINLGKSKVKEVNIANYFFHMANGFNLITPKELVVEGEALENLDVSSTDANYSDMLKLEVLDVSNCPSLKELNAESRIRKFKKIILKEGQEIPTFQKSDWTEIGYVK